MGASTCEVPDPLTACRRIARIIRGLPAVEGIAMDVPECRVGLGTWLRKVIAKAAKAQPTTIRWVDASEGLPDDESTVLIALSDGEVWTGFRDAGEWRFVSAELVDQGSGVTVTHWAPIPEAPTR